MHHKRKRHKTARAGCLMCKPHKHPASKHKLRKRLLLRADEAANLQIQQGD